MFKVVPCSLESGLGGNVKRFRGGPTSKAQRLSYHSTLGWRVIKEKKKGWEEHRDSSARGVEAGQLPCPRHLSSHPRLFQQKLMNIHIFIYIYVDTYISRIHRSPVKQLCLWWPTRKQGHVEVLGQASARKRGILLIRNSASLGPYSRTMPRA